MSIVTEKTLAVETIYIAICFHCYMIAQQLPNLTYAVSMNLYQIIDREAQGIPALCVVLLQVELQ